MRTSIYRSTNFRPSVFAFLALLLLTACSTPRVLEVSCRTRTQTINAADQSLFVTDAASRLRHAPRDLPTEDQREEFLVRWRGAGVDLVKFEYRQVDKPDTVLEQTLVLQQESCRSGIPAATGSTAEAPDRDRNVAPTKPGTVNREPGTVSHTFAIRGEDFRVGGPVSAWRLSLWNGDTLLAEKKSTLW